jgi:hypothetical protein
MLPRLFPTHVKSRSLDVPGGTINRRFFGTDGAADVR